MIVSADHRTVYDAKTNLTWDRSGRECRMDFEQAIAYAENANSQKHLGFDGWRVPTISELLSIVDFGKHGPAIDSKLFPGCQSSWYWSSTVYAPYPAFAWYVNFYYGDTEANGKAGYFFVRLVRSGN